MTVINKGQREATVTKLFIEVESKKGGELLDLSNRLFNSEALPMRIAAEDSAQVFPVIKLVYELLESHGDCGRIKIMPIVEDAVGHLHKAKSPFYISLGPRHEKRKDPPER